MSAMQEIRKRFQAILEALDSLAEQSSDDALEDMNAELEDALFMLSDIDTGSEDWREELRDMLETLEELRGLQCLNARGEAIPLLTPEEEIESRAGWEKITAVENHSILNLQNNELSRPVPRLVDGAKMLYDFVYGEEGSEEMSEEALTE